MKTVLSILFLNCVLAADKNWWKHSTIYEIFTPSFKDTNGDGYGDLRGILSQLNYLKHLGADVVWLTPFFPSPMVDAGYDVSNYVEINPLYGNMSDFNKLIQQLENRDMKLIMDFVINHSSDQHIWFQRSVEKIYPYTDYYIWRDPKGYDNNNRPIEPNNWMSAFGGTSAWTWNEERQQFYYHVFRPQQPDLNYRNRRLKTEIKKIIKFWLMKGVAGIRLDAASWIMEDPSFKDEEPVDPKKKNQKCNWFELKHDKTMNLPTTFKFIRELRQYLDRFSVEANTFKRILITRAVGNAEELKAFHGNESHPAADLSLNQAFNFHWDYMNPAELDLTIGFWLSIVPNNTMPNWLIDSPDIFRSSYIFIQEYVHILLTIITLLPGVTVLYYGNEIGMTKGVIRPDQRILWNEHARTPMQWDASVNGGFTTNKKAWLPITPDSWRLNVEEQSTKPHSTFNFLRNLLNLKKTNTIKYGDINRYLLSNWVYAFKRSLTGNEVFVIVLNLGTAEEVINLQSKIPNLPNYLYVNLTTENSGLKKGSVIKSRGKSSFVMKPMSVIVLRQKMKKLISHQEISPKQQVQNDQKLQNLQFPQTMLNPKKEWENFKHFKLNFQ